MGHSCVSPHCLDAETIAEIYAVTLRRLRTSSMVYHVESRAETAEGWHYYGLGSRIVVGPTEFKKCRADINHVQRQSLDTGTLGLEIEDLSVN